MVFRAFRVFLDYWGFGIFSGGRVGFRRGVRVLGSREILRIPQLYCPEILELKP